jgi:hypothetical protein
MTKEELIAQLKTIAARAPDGNWYPGANPGQNHLEADTLLLTYIADPDVTEAYESIEPKWYE